MELALRQCFDKICDRFFDNYVLMSFICWIIPLCFGCDISIKQFRNCRLNLGEQLMFSMQFSVDFAIFSMLNRTFRVIKCISSDD